MSNPLREHILRRLREGTQVPTLLYHYAPPATLLGIVHTRRIWATEVRHLNDSQEFRFAADLCEQLLQQHERREPDSPEGRFLSSLLRAHGDVRSYRVFAASFSELDDVLSQWRAYTPPSGGYAIGFAGESLQSGGSARLLQCVYKRARQEDLYGELLGEALESFRRIPEQHRAADGSDGQRVVQQYTEAFLVLIAAMKDPGFEEEREWRIVVHESLDGQTQPDYREGRGGIVPYIGLPFGSGEAPPPVQRVVVGPTPHGELALASVQSFLKQRLGRDVQVRLSKVPYRTW